MSQRFVFYRTAGGRQLHNGDDAMTESQAEVVLNDLWDAHKDALEKIAELEKELEFFYEEAMDSLAPSKEQG